MVLQRCFSGQVGVNRPRELVSESGKDSVLNQVSSGSPGLVELSVDLVAGQFSVVGLLLPLTDTGADGVNGKVLAAEKGVVKGHGGLLVECEERGTGEGTQSGLRRLGKPGEKQRFWQPRSGTQRAGEEE